MYSIPRDVIAIENRSFCVVNYGSVSDIHYVGEGAGSRCIVYYVDSPTVDNIYKIEIDIDLEPDPAPAPIPVPVP